MLRAANLLFRPFVPGDAAGFVAAVRESVPSLAPWMPWAHANYSPAEALSWIAMCQQGWEERTHFEFGIFNAVDGEFVGGCGLNQFNLLHGFCNLGYWVRQSCQRRGVATAAIKVLSDRAFAEHALGRVEIVVGVGNVGSLGAARKAGAVEEGIARNRLKVDDGFIDARVLALVPSTTNLRS